MRRFLGLATLLFIAGLAQGQPASGLPNGAVARLGVHRLRLPDVISEAAFTPDQRTLVVAFNERKEQEANVVLFDVATGFERKRLEIINARGLAIARDKPLMVVHTTKGFELWDLAAEKRIRQWAYPEKTYNASSI